MPADPIYVDNALFLRRVEEQKQFRAALTEVLTAPPDEDLPYIFLLYGDGGMGKTTLAKRFRDIAQTEPPFENVLQQKDFRGKICLHQSEPIKNLSAIKQRKGKNVVHS